MYGFSVMSYSGIDPVGISGNCGFSDGTPRTTSSEPRPNRPSFEFLTEATSRSFLGK